MEFFKKFNNFRQRANGIQCHFPKTEVRYVTCTKTHEFRASNKMDSGRYNTPVAAASRRLKQEDQELEATLGYIVRLCQFRKFKQCKEVQNIGYPIPKEPAQEFVLFAWVREKNAPGYFNFSSNFVFNDHKDLCTFLLKFNVYLILSLPLSVLADLSVEYAREPCSSAFSDDAGADVFSHLLMSLFPPTFPRVCCWVCLNAEYLYLSDGHHWISVSVWWGVASPSSAWVSSLSSGTKNPFIILLGSICVSVFP